MSRIQPTVKIKAIPAPSGTIDSSNVDHTGIQNIGTNSHVAIDTHIANPTAHGITGNVVGDTDTQDLSNKTLTTPKVDTINEETLDNGVTVDSLNIKDGKLNTNDSVITANIADLAVSNAKLANGAVTLAKTTNIVGTDAAIVQVRYGSAVVTTNISGSATVTFSSAFPTATLTVICINGDQASGNLLMTPITPLAINGFNFIVRQADTGAIIASAIVRINYIAIGY